MVSSPDGMAIAPVRYTERISMAPATYRFSDFHLDPASRELWRGNEEVSLYRKAYECLVYLIEHRDRAVSYDELFGAVWGDVRLSDSVLRQAIVAVRRALDDNGEEQRLIKTIWGFGYHWIAPVEMVEAPTGNGAAPPPVATAGPVAETRVRGKAIRWIPLALVAVGALVATTLSLRPGTESSTRNGAPPPRAEGEIAMLLPVTVAANTENAWIRLGLMDLMARRLQNAGQVMVPGDTVIALLRTVAPAPGPDELDTLAETTGADLVLAADAQASGTRWTVSLRTLRGAQPPFSTVGEAHDVLEAARAAADQMASALGATPSAESRVQPGLQKLLQQIEAARLAQQIDLARRLIEGADPALRRQPEIRLQRARIDFYGNDLDAAQAALESLRETVTADRDPLLRARVLNGLASVHIQRRDLRAARPLLDEAVRILGGDEPMLPTLGSVQTNLGVVTDMREDFDAARMHYAQARKIFEGIGDVKRLATIEHNVGMVELRRERYGEALRRLESAAERSAALQDVGGELRARAGMMHVHLGLLDPQAASELESRVRELLARTTNEQLAAYAKVNLAYLLDAQGRGRAAEGLMDDVLRTADVQEIPSAYRLAALLSRVERMMADGSNLAAVAELATEVIDGLADSPGGYEERARAWLIVVRAQLALGRNAAAAEAAAAMRAWAEGSEMRSPAIYAALAEAELAAAEGRREAARSAFDRAFRLADAGQVPLYVLRVAQSYVPWLLRDGSHRAADPSRALLIADRVSGFTDRHYGAALLQLRVYHALGPPSAWRAALAPATSLAGERRIPATLLDPPRARRAATD